MGNIWIFIVEEQCVVEKKKRKEKKGEKAQLFGIKIIKFFYIYILFTIMNYDFLF